MGKFTLIKKTMKKIILFVLMFCATSALLAQTFTVDGIN